MIIFSPSVRGCGRLTGAFEKPSGGIMALASEFDYLSHFAGRSAFGGHRLRYRLGLHHHGQARPFAWFDDLSLPINSVDFHPTEPVVAIGAGIHDGAYAFNGDLILWNWVDGAAYRPFRHLPEVIHLAFNAEGGLDLLFRPWNEDWGYGDDESVAYPLTLHPAGFEQVHDQAPIDPNCFNRLADLETFEPDYPEVRRRVARFLDTGTLAPSRPVWGIGWFGEHTVGWVTGERLLDLHDLATRQSRAVESEQHAVGLAIIAADRPLVQTVRSWVDPDGRHELQTGLVAMSDDMQRDVAYGPYTFGITASANGFILGRQVRKTDQPPRDFICDPTGRMHDAHFGIYDPYRDYLGVNGAPDLYILQTTSSEGDNYKQVCQVTTAGEVKPLWPLLPLTDRADQAAECCAAYVEDDRGQSLIVSGLYHPRPDSEHGFLYRRLLDGRELWRLSIEAAVTALAWLPHHGIIAAASLDGRLMLIEVATARLLVDGYTVVDGVPTVFFSMSAHLDGRLAFGGMDGQVMVVHVNELNAEDNVIELA